MNRFELIQRNTTEIVQEEELKKLLKDKKKPVAYWGTAPTGRIHVGYLIPLLKIADFIRAGFKFKILIADLHAHLDDQKTPWHLLEARSRYYKEIIYALLKALRIKPGKAKFIQGTSFQLSPDYTSHVLSLSANIPLVRSRKAAAEVVRFGTNPKVGGFIYPIMQTVDIHALKVDVTYSGLDQRGIYMLSRETLNLIGNKKPICVFSPMLPGLTGGKMSASEEKSKIDILDDKDVIKNKISKAYCVAGNVKNNSVLNFVEYFVFPFKNKLEIKREKKFGGDKVYTSYKSLEKDFASRKLHPQDLKNAVANVLTSLLAPVRKKFTKRKFKKILNLAYPKK